MKRLPVISLLTILLLLPGCRREEPFGLERDYLPDGTPLTLCLGFGAEEQYDVQVGTKAESSRVDESRIHDLYVMIFDNDDGGKKFYGRHFTYEHLIQDLSDLEAQPNEGWYVDNVTIDDVKTENTNHTAEKDRKKTRGVVKIATEAQTNCTVVLIANLSNTVFSLNGKDALTCLSGIKTLAELQQVKVVLEQNVMNRNDLFLMLGTRSALKIEDLSWGEIVGTTPVYNEELDANGNPVTSPSAPPTNSQIPLQTLDAKIKFRIRANSAYISNVNPRYWQAFRVPESCYLYPNNITWDTEQTYFNGLESYFETTETDNDGTWEVFTFYMLENRQTPLRSIENATKPDYYTSKYYLRELQQKNNNPDYPGFKQNGDWVYARKDATYVQFDVILTLNENGIGAIQQGISEALTTDAIFTVHLGDFTNSETGTGAQFDDYNTYRAHNYTYDIVINNTKSIYIEVRGDNGNGNLQEQEPGQEGSLLLTTTGIINCDAHYEYHSMTFKYDKELGESKPGYANRKKYAWYVKTPFGEGSGEFQDATGWYVMPKDNSTGYDVVDCDWVKFALNDKDDGTGKYKPQRKKYPGTFAYNKAWGPGELAYPPAFLSQLSSDERTLLEGLVSPKSLSEVYVPILMDINQLVNFLFWQNELQYKKIYGLSLTEQEINSICFDSPDNQGQMRVTAFVDEFYYERHPLTGELDPNLWREYVNALPRELHILSDSEHSLDRRSDVIVSSHSVVQQSIQTIYNIYAPDLTSIWGTEHKDEMSAKNRSKTAEFDANGWPWWGEGAITPTHLYDDDENGRLNTAGIWNVYEDGTPNPLWDTFLDFEIDDDTSELSEAKDKNYQAYSCLTRNRDNNGNGVIDPDELRWYMASINQLVGMWVGNESLTQSARLYQPIDKNNTTNALKWRSVTISSTTGSDITNPMNLRSEEGATKSWYNTIYGNYTEAVRKKVTSVRCLRNIGTFKDRGVVEDISYAPLDYMVDQYYDCETGLDKDGKAWPNPDGTYTIRFSRLNAKSIREYTAEDLPFHDEESMQNRVYLRFTAQNPDNYIFADGDPGINLILSELNNNITKHNDYCPPGYRLPNMTEMLMMASILPESYWCNIGSKRFFPCRTYWSRGSLGSRPTETDKIGWGYNLENATRRVNMRNNTDKMYGIRCVRDDNMIGDITGKLSVADSDHQRIDNDPENLMSIDLNFSSMASVINDIKVKLCYVDASGRSREEEISHLHPSDMSVRRTIKYKIPNDLYYLTTVRGFLTVQAVVRNAYGIERVFEAPVRLVSSLYTSIRLLPSEYDPLEYTSSKPVEFPVLITAAHYDTKVDSWTLRVTTPDNRTTSYNVDSIVPSRDQLTSGTTYASAIYTYRPGTLKVGTYSFQLEAVCDGVTTRSEVVSMDVLKVDFDPLSGVDVDAVEQASDIAAYRWEREMIEGLDFSSGDFIETDMDIHRCVYKQFPLAPAAADKNRSLGMDNLISFGVNDIDWVPWSLHICYPSVDQSLPGSRWLYFTPAWGTMTGELGYWGKSYSVITMADPPTAPMHIRLDKNGCHWNGRWMDVAQWPLEHQSNVQSVLDKLANARTVYIGSVEDVHRSRAIYRFVRVVRNGRYSSTRDGNDSFEDNPIHGGNL